MSSAARLRGEVRGDTILLSLFSAVILASVLMSTDEQVASLFGWDLPPLCLWKNLFGKECPGCGLTRSFVFTAHGHLEEGFTLNKMGPVLWVLAAAQIPLRAVRLWRAKAALKALEGAQ